MADFLLELFSEEIPARMQAAALEHLQSALKTGLNAASAKGFVTPRRLAVIIENLPAAQPDISTELKGPKLDAPEAALQGFLKKTGLKPEQLEKRDGVYFASVHQKGRPTPELLKELIEKILANFPWPKSMRWGNNDITWVRPLHSILCIFDGNIIPVQFGTVTASNVTHGHRFLSPTAITIKTPGEYEAALEKAHVIADREKRKANILAQAEKAAAGQGLSLKKDDGLLEEVTGLVEWPVVLAGSIAQKFMDLPPEVLISEMRAHQKYFALQAKDGSLSDKFLITANMETSDGGKAIIAGNERVLSARFSDARFFWDQDRKKPLSDWAEGLKTVTFHAKLGSIADKVARIETLALALAEYTPGADKKRVAQAAKLCKADLVTGMVGEFAELQGIMGRYYAQAQKEDAAVADAIRDHYKPQGPADSVPKEPVAICIALADKLDTLIKMFEIKEYPTGSKDPFALRRAALGIIRIILENDIRLNLGKIISGYTTSIKLPLSEFAKNVKIETNYKNSSADDSTIGQTVSNSELIEKIESFFSDRLKVQLKDQGIRHDVIAAIVADGDDDLVRIVARAKALQDFLGTEDGKNLLTAYKRAANILSIEEKKDKTSYKPVDLQENSLKEAEEKSLASLLSSQSGKITALTQKEDFAGAMTLLAGLRSPVDQFFEKIMVNAEDKELRGNRLRLLARIRETMNNIAQFTLIEG